jgi:hypothetical protein
LTTQDVLVAIDGAKGKACFEIAPAQNPSSRLVFARVAGESLDISPPLNLPADLRRPKQLEIADLDRDGLEDLVVTFEGSAPIEAGCTSPRANSGAGIMIIFNTGRDRWPPIDLDNRPGIQIALPNRYGALLSATVVRAGGKATSIAAATECGGIVLLDPSGAIVMGAGIGGADLGESFTARVIVAADLNHDGLDDLIVGDGLRVEPFLSRARSP